MSIREPESLGATPLVGAAQMQRPRKHEADVPQRSSRAALLWIVGLSATCAILVYATAALVDRPVADWVHAHLGDARFDWFEATYKGHLLRLGPFSLMAGPAEALQPLAVLAFAILAISVAVGPRLGTDGRNVLAFCLSIFASSGICSAAKEVFGRTWPESWLGDNPSWIRDGVFGFFPFHGGMGWASFPSGHATAITTVGTVLWFIWPELRWGSGAVVVIVIIGLIGGNYHFVSDIIGGLFLGVGVGFAVVVVLSLGRFSSRGYAGSAFRTKPLNRDARTRQR